MVLIHIGIFTSVITIRMEEGRDSRFMFFGGRVELIIELRKVMMVIVTVDHMAMAMAMEMAMAIMLIS